MMLADANMLFSTQFPVTLLSPWIHQSHSKQGRRTSTCDDQSAVFGALSLDSDLLSVLYI